LKTQISQIFKDMLINWLLRMYDFLCNAIMLCHWLRIRIMDNRYKLFLLHWMSSISSFWSFAYIWVHSKKHCYLWGKETLRFLSLIGLLQHGMTLLTRWLSLHHGSWIIIFFKMSWLTKEKFVFKFNKGNWKALYDQISTTETMPSNLWFVIKRTQCHLW